MYLQEYDILFSTVKFLTKFQEAKCDCERKISSQRLKPFLLIAAHSTHSKPSIVKPEKGEQKHVEDLGTCVIAQNIFRHVSPTLYRIFSIEFCS